MSQKQQEITNTGYLYLFNTKIKNKFNRDYSPKLMIEIWNELLENCEYGYADSIFELDDELSIREYIEFALYDTDLSKYTDHCFFVSQIEQIDSAFKKIIQMSNDNKKPWWKNVVLKYARGEYVQQMKLYRNIIIEQLE